MTSVSRIRQLLGQERPKFAQAFLRMVAGARQRATRQQIERMILSGAGLDELLEEALRSAAPLASQFQASFVASAETAANAIGRAIGQADVLFDTVNESAVQAMRGNQIRMVTAVNNEQRRAIRQVLLDGVQDGLNPIEQAREIRRSIGLTADQTRAVRNYRRALESGNARAMNYKLRDRRFDSTVTGARRAGRSLTGSQVQTMVDRYAERAIAHRAKVIARTEALRAVNQGTENMFDQAFESGDLQREQVIKEWNTAKDQNVRDSHRSLHGDTTTEGEAFITEDGVSLRYPGDPDAPASETIQCRCAVGRRINIDVASSGTAAGVVFNEVST